MFHEGVLLRYRALDAWEQTALQVSAALVVGYLLLRLIKARLDTVLLRAPRVDATVRVFLVRVAYGFGWVLLAAFVLSLLGVDLTALLGGLAIGGFILGFALKDTLGNLAAGLMLLIYRPFNIDDIVQIDGFTGRVRELGLALTVIQLFDGKLVTVPNGSVLGGPIVNFTRHGMRRMEVRVGIAYDDDIETAIAAIRDALAREPRVLPDPAPEVVVVDLGPSSVDLEVRAWARNEDFGAINDLRPLVKRALTQAGCTIPFPQREVRVHQASS